MSWKGSDTPAWSSVQAPSPPPSSPPPSSPPPSVEEPGLYPVATYTYSINSSHSGYEEKDNGQSGIGTFKSGQDVSREAGAGVKALSLLDQEFGPGQTPPDLDDDKTDIKKRKDSGVSEYKSNYDKYRESQSQSMALRLLSKSVAKEAKRSNIARQEASHNRSVADKDEEEVKSNTSQEVDVAISNTEEVSNYKSDFEKYRESQSQSLALRMLSKSVAKAKRCSQAGEVDDEVKSSPSQEDDGDNPNTENVSNFKSDVEKYRDSCSEVKAMALLNESVSEGKEQMSITTRQKKPQTPEDLRDAETLAGMKCQLDLEREQLAQQKALRLLRRYEEYIF